MSDVKRKKRLFKEEQTDATGPYEKAVRAAAKLYGWEVKALPALDTENGYITITSRHDVEVRIRIMRGHATDDNHWKNLFHQVTVVSQGITIEWENA